MKLSLPLLQQSRKKLEAVLLSNKAYITTLLILNTAYILPKFNDRSDASSVLIASIPPIFIISLVTTLARDRYIKNTLLRRMMEDSYIPSVYKSNIDLRALNSFEPLKKERAQTRHWIETNILDRLSSK